MHKKRIVIDGEVIVTPHFSGIGHYTLELLKAIDRAIETDKRFNISLIIHFRHIEKARSYGFKHIKIVPSPFSLRIANGLKTKGKQPPLDLLFGKGTYIFPNFTSWPLIFSNCIPIIYDLSYEKYPEYAEPRNQAFLSTQVKIAAQRASMIATISENSRHEISEYYSYPLNKIGVYYPAVDTSQFHTRNSKEIARVKRAYGITGEYILFVGNIEPRKNLKNLLLAYERLDSAITKKISLVLIGAKGWQDDAIIDTIDRLRKRDLSIQMPSRHVEDNDLPAFYSGASLFVYPSIYEGFGIPPLEAMACGTAVVCADNSSLPEVVGDAAIMVNALSIDDICQKMQLALTNKALRQSSVKRGHSQVNRFSWDSSAKKLLKDIEELR